MNTNKPPLIRDYAINQFLLFMVLLVVILYFAKDLIMPLVFAAFFAMLMAPICRKLERKNVGRPFSVLICVFILLVALLSIFAVIIGEVASFTDDLPSIQKKLYESISGTEVYIQQHFNISPPRQVAIIKEQISTIGKSAGSYLGKAMGGIATTFGALILTLVYTFLLLYNKEKYENFFIKLYGKSDPEKAKEVIEEIATVGEKYIYGRILTIIFFWIMYSIAFSLIGIKSAILLAAIVSILTIIPYVGSIIGGIFPLLMALATEDSMAPAVWVIAVLIFVHALSTYFIEPAVIGSKVKLSALAMIVGLIAGGFVWGIAGMIIFIPVLAIAKIIFENVDRLNPYGYLIGDPDEGAPSKIEEWLKAKFSKKQKHIKSFSRNGKTN